MDTDRDRYRQCDASVLARIAEVDLPPRTVTAAAGGTTSGGAGWCVVCGTPLDNHYLAAVAVDVMQLVLAVLALLLAQRFKGIDWSEKSMWHIAGSRPAGKKDA